MTPHILVVDDEHEISDLIEIFLMQEGYLVTKRDNALSIVSDIKENNIDLVILDVMMPGIDGMSALTQIRENFNIPVIMLSAKSSDNDKVEGLLLGADDYMGKPFNAKELVARVKSQLRRANVFNQPVVDSSHIITASDIVIDLAKKSVTLDNKYVPLTRIEYEILVLLASTPGRVYSSEEIFNAIWHEKSNNPNNTIMVHIRKLREKIEREPRTPKHVITVWGIGYKFDL